MSLSHDEPRGNGERSSGRPDLQPGEHRLVAFISSVMSEELQDAREETVRALQNMPGIRPWAFEFTPGSTEPVVEGYLRHVREADFVIWLVGTTTTDAVRREIREALASDRRLFVLKLPTPQRDTLTEELLTEVGLRAKWIEPTPVGGVRQALEMTLVDDIIRAVRGRTSRLRDDLLDELRRASRARCIQRWQAAWVSYQTACELVDDLAVGQAKLRSTQSTGLPVTILLGEMGVGKSLIAERLLQNAIQTCTLSANAPLPVYIEARSVTSNLRAAIERECEGLGDPRTQGIVAVVDEAETVGAQRASELLSDARILAGTWPNSRIVITSRPISPFNRAEECTEIQRLTFEEALALIARVSGGYVQSGLADRWSVAMREAITVPLFAILVGTYLRDHNFNSPPSTGALLTSLVTRATAGSARGGTYTQEQLERLAVASTEREGGPIPLSELGNRNDVTDLLATGFLVERSDGIGFALQLLTHWFAANSLARGVPNIAELADDKWRLELWRYPLVLGVNFFDHQQVSRLLQSVVATYPGFAARVVREGLDNWDFEGRVALPPAGECESRLKLAVSAWASAIGPLAPVVGFMSDDGGPPHIRVKRSTDRFLVECTDVWEHSEGQLEPGRQSAWAWRWTLDALSSRVRESLDRRLFPLGSSFLAREVAWHTALDIANQSSISHEPIPLARLEPTLRDLLQVGPVVTLHGRYHDLGYICTEVERLRSIGQDQIFPPWPGPDLPYSSSWLWSSFSDERTLERIETIFRGAVEGYGCIVEACLMNLAPHLTFAVTLPGRVTGILMPAGHSPGAAHPPFVHWHLEPLPPGGVASVDIQFGEIPDHSQLLLSLVRRVQAARPDAARWITASTWMQLVDFHSATPATDLAYRWLKDDLTAVLG